jgi:RimJ/RimL family protein N-acetyltransferase
VTLRLQGEIVRLEPLNRDHTAELQRISGEAQIWRYLTTRAGSPEEMEIYVDRLLGDLRSGTAMPFVVRTASDSQAAGLTRLKNISRENRKALVGSWFAPSAWGSGVNTESKLLLLEYAFESLNLLRVEFQTDSRNMRSRNALSKMGAIEEGTLRSYLITADGDRRDTVVFSVLDRDWPAVKQRLRQRLEAQTGNGGCR